MIGYHDMNATLEGIDAVRSLAEVSSHWVEVIQGSEVRRDYVKMLKIEYLVPPLQKTASDWFNAVLDTKEKA